jgi:CRISPR-associated protein Cas2
MFVSVICDCASEEHRGAVHDTLRQHGFRKTVKDAFESAAVTDALLVRLKRELDRICDSYDSIVLYQYPVENTLAITTLKEKKWRRLIVKP